MVFLARWSGGLEGREVGDKRGEPVIVCNRYIEIYGNRKMLKKRLPSKRG
jgi:hypothetical protein